MKIYYSNAHSMHNPSYEVVDGGVRTPYLETPQRMDRILSVLEKQPWAELTPQKECDLQPILAVHTSDYVEFLRSAFDEWQFEATDYEKQALLPATFAPRNTFHRPRSLLGKAGYHMMDLSAPILAGTFEAALNSAACALSGAEALFSGDSAALALCRPPGHHAGRETCGGYCYLNNASIATQWLSAKGRVAILDIDYHAGNGTQEIFYDRGDVLTISIHADPDDHYPHFSGYIDETGTGAGFGAHRNFPLPDGTGDDDYRSTLGQAIQFIQEFEPRYMVVSAGLDIYEGDPMGTFKISLAGVHNIGRSIRALNLPTLFVMEGGYDQDSLGTTLIALLEPFT